MTARAAAPAPLGLPLVFWAAAALFLLLAAWLSARPEPTRVDWAVQDALASANPDGRYQWGDSFREEATDVAVYALAYAALVVATWRYGTMAAAAALAATVVLHELFVLGVQAAVDRPRPPGAWDPHGSFPSGHVANFVLAVLLFLLLVLPRMREKGVAATSPREDRAYAAVLVALYAGYRVFSGEHWATDVVGSVALATAWGVGAARWARPLLAR